MYASQLYVTRYATWNNLIGAERKISYPLFKDLIKIWLAIEAIWIKKIDF